MTDRAVDQSAGALEIASEPHQPATTSVVLFVDDEPAVLRSLERLFHAEAGITCLFANSPLEALRIITDSEVGVIVSDHRMPQMTGAEFLAKLHAKRPAIVTIMLTGHADFSTMQFAVNEGEVFRFLTKPWDDDELKHAVRRALDQYRLHAENTRLMRLTQEQNERLTSMNDVLNQSVAQRTRELEDALTTAKSGFEKMEMSIEAIASSLFSIIELARPSIGMHSRRVALWSDNVAKALGLPPKERKTVRIAALLHDIGKVGLPAFILEKAVVDMNVKELEVYKSHPEAGSETLKQIEYLNEVREIIQSHHERADGSGFPEGAGGSKVPFRALLVGIADEYDHLSNRVGWDPDFALQVSQTKLSDMSGKKFPEKVVAAMIECVNRSLQPDAIDNERQVEINNLIVGSQLARNVYSLSGTLLLASSTVLSAQMIKRIRDIANIDPLAGPIWVKAETSKRDA